jgi:ABC transport system ATP-binding/permease protein
LGKILKETTGVMVEKTATKAGSAHIDGLNPHETNGVLLQVKGLSIRSRAGLSLLSDLSFHIEPGELVLLSGPSLSGKSILLQNLTGLMKPSSGEILIDGINLYPNLNAFRSRIGYVPAEFPMHEDLTVAEILQDEARLRMPRSATNNDRKHRVQTLLETVGLTTVINNRIGTLSKAEKRRLAIAVELVGYPGILLLDEPAESLTPPETVQITALLRRLSRQGLTVVQVNDLSKSVGLSDKVIFLAPGGLLAWFGPAAEALTYFESFTPGEREKKSFESENVLEILVNPQMGDGTEWAKRFRADPAFQKYVDDPLNNRYPDLLLETRPLIKLRSNLKEKQAPVSIPRANGAQKLFLFIWQNLRMLWRSKAGAWMLAIPPLVGLVDFVLSSDTMSDPQFGDPNRLPIVLGLLVFLDLLIAALLAQTGIFGERAIYQRQRRTNSLSVPYILSKVWLVGIFAIYQGSVWTIIHFVAIGMTEGFLVLPAYSITFFLVALTGGIIGLLASALARKSTMISVWILLLTVPQLFLSGSIIPLTHLSSPFIFLSNFNPSRYAFETLLTTSGYGQDIVSDPCWQLPVDQRNSLSDFQKQSCNCMGVNIFSMCRFPGIHATFSFAIEQPEPVAPTASSTINNMPIQPLLKPGETLDQFAAEVDAYTSQLEIYQGNYDAFLSSIRQYSVDLANWQRMRSLIIGNAEGEIAEAIEHYGQAFNVNLFGHWLILAAMSSGLIILLIVIQQGKGTAKS